MSYYFFVRIELHGASWSNYELLHEAMGEAGFSRTIVGSNGTEYHLPTAEYVLIGNYVTDHVRDKADRAAARTGKKRAVLVAKSSESAWSGLEPVEKYAWR
jgi:hypothetical protein